MKYIFLIASFNALFFSFLILQKKKALHDKILICWLIYLGFYTGIYGLFSDKLFTGFHLLSVSFISLLLLHGPFLYFYISALIDNKAQFNRAELLHFVPFILFNLFIIISSFIFYFLFNYITPSLIVVQLVAVVYFYFIIKKAQKKRVK